jgi:dUTP pyrophosphatase
MPSEIQMSEDVSGLGKLPILRHSSRFVKAIRSVFRQPSDVQPLPRVTVPVKLKKLADTAKLPQCAYSHDSGMDLVATIDCVLQPFERIAIPTGWAAEVPPGFELQIRPRSSLALRYGVTVLNTPGTIDAGYRGEIKVILINLGTNLFHVHCGQKIAQLVVAPVVTGTFQIIPEHEDLAESQRGCNGFGSTDLIDAEFYQSVH